MYANFTENKRSKISIELLLKGKKTDKTLLELDERDGKTKFGEMLIFAATPVCFLYRSVLIDQQITGNISDSLLCNKLTKNIKHMSIW